MSGRYSVGLVMLLAAIVAGIVLTRGAAGVEWEALRPGLEFTVVRGEPYCRRGSADIGVLRIDTERFRLAVHHYSEHADERPLGIVEWQRRTRGVAVFNAGQYYPDMSYMGLLISNGSVVSGTPHPEFKAALVAEPTQSQRRRGTHARRARVLDLETDELRSQEPPWEEVAQSFMLFDRHGTVRVRKSDRVANRTVVGEDAQGRLLVITTEGGYTLWELAQLLQAGHLDLKHAMCMDGGAEAKLVIKMERFAWASFGPWDGRDDGGVRADVPLPAVVAVYPR